MFMSDDSATKIYAIILNFAKKHKKFQGFATNFVFLPHIWQKLDEKSQIGIMKNGIMSHI